MTPGARFTFCLQPLAYLSIAYAHCIAHGINMTTAVDEQKKVVSSGDWTASRFEYYQKLAALTYGGDEK